MWTESQSSLLNRRDWLRHAGGGLGSLALASLLSRDGWLHAAETSAPVNSLTPRPPHFPARAKAVIYLFMHGGPSHVDTFDPKPALNKFDGQPPPEEFHQLKLQFTDVKKQKLMGSPQTFTRCGRSGIEICDSLTQLRQCAHASYELAFRMQSAAPEAVDSAAKATTRGRITARVSTSNA